MSFKNALRAASALTLVTATGAFAENLVIATVNNNDMIVMQGLTDDFTEKTGHTVEWVTLEENVLRQRVTTTFFPQCAQGLAMTAHSMLRPSMAKARWCITGRT